MNRGITRLLRKLRRLGSRLRFDGFGFTVPPFTASITLREKRKRTAIVRLTSVRPIKAISPFETVLDTVETITDTERKRAIRRRDWPTAIGAALVQDYVRQTRMKGRGTPA